MSYKAFYYFKNQVEIEFLKSCSYEKINEMMNQLNEKIKKHESENAELRASSPNSDYAELAKWVHDCVSFGGSVEQVEDYLRKHFA